MWGADSVTNTPVYPCDNGDCTEVNHACRLQTLSRQCTDSVPTVVWTIFGSRHCRSQGQQHVERHADRYLGQSVHRKYLANCLLIRFRLVINCLISQNEPDVPLFWDRSQDQYFQMWDYAFQKYRTAFPASSGVTISGPAYTGPPNEGNSWWTKWADHMKNKPAVYPDVITYHQLLGRQDSFNDPFESKRVLDIIQSKNNLPRKLVQVNGEY